MNSCGNHLSPEALLDARYPNRLAIYDPWPRKCLRHRRQSAAWHCAVKLSWRAWAVRDGMLPLLQTCRALMLAGIAAGMSSLGQPR